MLAKSELEFEAMTYSPVTKSESQDNRRFLNLIEIEDCELFLASLLDFSDDIGKESLDLDFLLGLRACTKDKMNISAGRKCN